MRVTILRALDLARDIRDSYRFRESDDPGKEWKLDRLIDCLLDCDDRWKPRIDEDNGNLVRRLVVRRLDCGGEAEFVFLMTRRDQLGRARRGGDIDPPFASYCHLRKVTLDGAPFYATINNPTSLSSAVRHFERLISMMNLEVAE